MKHQNRNQKQDDDKNEKGKLSGSKATMMKTKKKNMKRLGGSGLSLEAFANVKSNNSHYNPGILKKQKEFYKNAKYVKKFKKQFKQQSHPNDQTTADRSLVENDDTRRCDDTRKKNKKKGNPQSLKELYEKQREEKEKEGKDREALVKAKREEKEKAQVKRKETREKMFKKTKYGQPIMKHRIEHLLQAIQGSD